MNYNTVDALNFIINYDQEKDLFKKIFAQEVFNELKKHCQILDQIEHTNYCAVLWELYFSCKKISLVEAAENLFMSYSTLKRTKTKLNQMVLKIIERKADDASQVYSYILASLSAHKTKQF